MQLTVQCDIFTFLPRSQDLLQLFFAFYSLEFLALAQGISALFIHCRILQGPLGSFPLSQFLCQLCLLKFSMSYSQYKMVMKRQC